MSATHVKVGYFQVGHLYQHIGSSHGVLVVSAELAREMEHRFGARSWVVYTILLDDGTVTKTRWLLHDDALAYWELVSGAREIMETSDER